MPDNSSLYLYGIALPHICYIWEFASLLYLYLLKWHYRHVMNLSTLIKQYFSSKNEDLTIDVFDEKNIYDVYQRVVGVLTQYIEIETTVFRP